MDRGENQGQPAVERSQLEDRLARAQRRLDKCAALLVEQRERVEVAEETGLRLGEAKALLKIYEDSHRQFTQDCDRARALISAFDNGSPSTGSP
jgi:hypothetical protein